MRVDAFLIVSTLWLQPVAMTWPDAVAPLAEHRAQVEICVGVIKRHGDSTQVAKSQLAYAKAKAEADALIEGLITALATRDTPGGLTSLNERIAKSASALEEYCKSVSDTLSAQPGLKDIWAALTKILAIEPLINKLSAGVAALYNDYRSDNAVTRKVIQNQLENARWPDFAKVAPVP
jgi:hypothetical protein